MAFVLDASIALAWAFPDEQSDVADTALTLLRTEQGLVSALWWFEMCNALIAGERRAPSTGPTRPHSWRGWRSSRSKPTALRTRWQRSTSRGAIG